VTQHLHGSYLSCPCCELSRGEAPVSHRLRRHPAEVTADRLGDAVTRWADQFTQAEHDYVGLIIHRLEQIAEQEPRR
jgi:hypothetical protein